ncbi:hypothetical protein ABI59_18850 [Acidobacteria bacterium Mor1]|nr:hypothetical protein ABI59_18850 [Acidobacteria bacterium Mor1]
MCGIAGVLELSGRDPSVEGLKRMASVLSHRGPDEQGHLSIGPMGLAHTRLSIIDLAAGQQPMISRDGNVSLSFNGEIYNFLELRELMEQRGHGFRTRCDTEVLLELYQERGLDAFAELNGMFAAAFWDKARRRLVLARDRFGKKPLFYYQSGERFVFGSEIKALLAYGGAPSEINPAALHDFLTYSYPVGDETILQGIKRLPPGHTLVLEDGRINVKPYWQLDYTPTRPAPSFDEALERTRDLLEAAVKRRMISDVPLGAFLSGGIDSSTVVALMSKVSSEPVRTFSIGFEEADYSELDDAREVAEHLGTDHQEIVVKPSAIDLLPDLVWHLDEPFGDSSAVPTYYVCQAARKHVTVALSGDGGDETFAGYPRYLHSEYYGKMSRVPGWLRKGVVRPLTGALPFTAPGWNWLHALGHVSDGPHGLGIYPYIRDQLYTGDFLAALDGYDPFDRSREHLARVADLDPVSKHQYLDTHVYLPDDILVKVDRMSMAVSLEVRAPLLDFELVEYIASLPLEYKLQGGITKRILREAVAPLLPPASMTKKKQGFAIPKDQWFRGVLKGVAEEVLLEPRTLQRGYFREAPIKRMLRHHQSGKRDYSTWIWCLLMLEMWFRTVVEGERIKSLAPSPALAGESA